MRLAIPDDGVSELRSTAIVQGVGTPTQIEITFNIQHENVSDLTAVLIAPNGQEVKLFSHIGGTGDNFVNTRLRSGSTNKLFDPLQPTQQQAPFNGVFGAEEDLAQLLASNPNGTWTLVLRDTEGGNVGTLLDWKLSFGGPQEFPATRASAYSPGTWNQYHVHVGTSSLVTLQFGDYRLATINGFKFQDDNGNGVQDTTEHGLGGVMLFVDINDNGVRDQGEPRGFTLFDDPNTPQFNEEGYFTIGSVAPGIGYQVREELTGGFRQTSPADDGVGKVTAKVVSLNSGDAIGTSSRDLAKLASALGGEPLPSHGLTFANQPLGAIRGTKWRDLNSNAIRDANEPGWAGVRVYVDLNNNGLWDGASGGNPAEPFAITVEDDPSTVGVDEKGRYSLSNVPIGDYIIREVVPLGATQTSTGLQPMYSSNFEGPGVPAEWSSASGLSIGELEGGAFYLSPTTNQSVQLSLSGLPSGHNTLHVEFDLFVLGGWNGVGGTASGDEDSWSLQAATGSGTDFQFTTTFANIATPSDPTLLQSYPNQLGGVLNPAYAGASEIRTLSSMLPGGELLDSVYHLSFDIPHVGTSALLTFLSSLQIDPELAKAWGIDNFEVSVPSSAQYVTLGARNCK